MKLIKIIAVILAICLAMVTISLATSATDEYTLRAVREQQLNVLNMYCEGQIDYDTYIEKSNELTMMLYDETTASGYVSAEAEKIGNIFKGISNKIGTTAQTYGDAAYEYVNNAISDYLNPYSSTTTQNTTDMQGYGAKLVRDNYVGGVYVQEYFCEYIYIDLNRNNNVWVKGSGYYNTYQNGKLTGTATFDNGWSQAFNYDTGYYTLSVYGDVRYSDGTQAPTDDEFVEIPILEFDGVSTYEIDELLNNINEELERTEPDLSNVEGLLNSIYFRLGKLDSDNDNALLAEINAAILSLANSNNANTTQLILKLDEIKQALNPEGEDENPEEQEPTDLTGVIEELKEINAGIKGLAAIEVVENIWELTEGEQQLFNEYASLIPLIVDKLGLGLVQATMSDIESLIFTSSPPSDLTVEMYGSEYALLSRDMFNEESLKYVNLAKNFVTVLIIYAWCMSMRKKLGGVE